MIQEEQRRALILKNQQNEKRMNVIPAVDRAEPPEQKAWHPIVGIDNSYFEH